ncbi:MAG: diguanylate cyclase [Burkholderiaceae bacterium]|nr:diguanylate cyclase [Burkholderiaceae bacterium]
MQQTHSKTQAASGTGRRIPSTTVADLRISFALERRFLLAVFVFGAIAALAALDRAPAVWWWLAAFALNAGLRFVVAAENAQARNPVTPASRAAQFYLLSYAAELMLWAALLGSIVPPQRPGTSSIAFAAGGALLLSALALAGWRRAWALYFAGWAALTLLVVSRNGFRLDAFSIGFPVWLLATWWIGRANAALRLRLAERTLRAPADGRTRLGWTMAIRAVPSPVLVVRAGRIAEVNSAAAQLLGRAERELVGLRVDECLRVEPLEALDPLRTIADGRSVEVTPRTGAGAGWSGRVRVLQPGRADSAIVIALTRPLETPTKPVTKQADRPEQRLAEDARRFADWIVGQHGEPWYRDGEGRLYVPPGLIAPDAPAARPLEFPLLHAVDPAQRARVAAAYSAALRSGRVFDQTVTLLDPAGKARELRVVCVARAGTSAWPPLIGTIAPADAGAGAPPSADTEADLLTRLPVLVWMIDASGRIAQLRGKDPWRWGLVQPAETRPLWIDAFGFRDRTRDELTQAIARALKGRPTFDLINARHTRAGGRIVLRSHVLPYVPLAELSPGEPDAPVVIVLDTIASPQQLSEIDRLRRSKAHYKALVEASTSLIWACDAQLNFTFASRRAAREIYGYEPNELIGRPVDALLATQVDQGMARRALEALRLGQTLRDVEMTHQTKDGRRLIVSVSAVPLKAGDGAFAGAIGMNADLTMLKQRERRLAEALRIERTVLDAAGQAIAVVKDGRIARCNDAFLQLMQVLPAVLARTPIAEFFVAPEEWEAIAAAADAARAEDRATVREVQIQRGARGAGGLTAWCQLTVRSIAPHEYVLVLADIDYIRRREADALHDAQHDELTGLPNRRLLATRAATALAASALRNSQCAVIAIDLDGFKEINDQYGHEVGDTVLREVALRLARVLRPQDTVARRGGDEFAMLIPDVGTRTDVERIAVRILQSVAQPVLLTGGQPGTVSASLGIALAPEQGRDLERLLQLADLAMYEAKLKGKNRYAFATTPQPGAVGGSAQRAAQAS